MTSNGRSPASGEPDLIASLVAGLRPAPPLPPPGRRSLLWLGWVLLIASLAVGFSPEHVGVIGRLLSAADMMTATVAAGVTAVAAAIAAFHVALPDRSSTWAWLPLPPALVWIAASTFGCMRSWLPAGWVPGAEAPAHECFQTILLISLPLSLVLGVMLRLAAPLRPILTAALAGLAAAAGSATVLSLIHPFDAAASDLLVHLAAVLLVIGVNMAAGRLLGR